ncbi:MAG TPA: DnaJ domain-containing protein, partial [Gammaproteobacteria bacterium]|nr:DnaJ domain-containing protein [Gammaproteobacteria bacterium]
SMFLQIQLHAALAEGALHPAERQALERVCAALGISEFEMRQYEQFIRAQQTYSSAGRGRAGPQVRRQDDMAAAYQTLGVSPQAADAEVKTAYRRLMKENHPDKLVARGLPEAMIKLAQEKVQLINVAYEAIKHARGMK